MELWGRTKQVVVGTGNKPMKASCIGAASMTSGFGPSYQECLWLCRKAKLFSPSPPNIVLCIQIRACIAFCIWSSWKILIIINQSINHSSIHSFIIIIQASQHFGSWTEQMDMCTSAGPKWVCCIRGSRGYRLSPASFLPSSLILIMMLVGITGYDWSQSVWLFYDLQAFKSKMGYQVLGRSQGR